MPYPVTPAGMLPNPTYEEVSAGGTGHVESVKVIYDPKTVTYSKLLDVFWRHVNPTDNGGQFVDRGSNTVALFFTQTTGKNVLRKSQKKSFRYPASLMNRSSRKFFPWDRFIRRKNITRITIKKIPSATSFIGLIPAGTGFLKSLENRQVRHFL